MMSSLKEIKIASLFFSIILVCFYGYLLLAVSSYFFNTNPEVFDLFVEGKVSSNFILIICLFLIFKKRVSLPLLGISAVLSFLCSYFFFFEEALFEVLREVGLVTNMTNSQWPRVVFAIVVLTLIGLKFMIKKERTLDRFFFIVSAVVVFVTTLIFHRITAQEALRSIEKEKRLIFLQVTSLENEEFIEKCSNSLYFCFENGRIIPSKKTRTLSTKNIENIVKFVKNRSSSALLEQDEEYLNVLVTQNGHRSILDVYDYNKKKMQQVNIFYFLSLCAHTSWSFIALLLSYLHRRKGLTFLRKLFYLS